MYNWFKELCEKLLKSAAPESPPGDESTMRLFRASPKYFKYLAALWLLQSALFLLPLLTVGGGLLTISYLTGKETPKGTPIVIAGLCIVLIFFALQRLFRLAVLRLDYEKRWYVVTDRSLRVREGVVNVQEMTVTFANIQNISISQGPLQRLLGIADLRVDTAGGGGSGGHSPHPGHDLHVAWFRGVDNANEVRELIQARLKRLKDTGLGDFDESQESIGQTGTAQARQSCDLSAAAVILKEVYAEAAALRLAVSKLSNSNAPR